MLELDKWLGRQSLAALESERKELLEKAYNLERSLAKKLVVRSDYNDIHSAIHKKLVLLDLEKSMEGHAQKMAELQEAAAKHSRILFEMAEVVAKKASAAIEEARDAKSEFVRNRINAGDFHRELAKANSAVVEAAHEILSMVKKAQKDKAMQIISETKRLLKNAESESKEAPGRKKVEVEVPKREHVRKLKHYSKKKKRKHLA